MSLAATVYRILVASPSDVSDKLEITKSAINNWNTKKSELLR